jgi:hypothetical protein
MFAGLGLWCRLWQYQIDQSMRFWAIWAGGLPKPTAAQLSAEAERLRDRVSPAEHLPRVPRAGRTRPQQSPATTLH